MRPLAISASALSTPSVKATSSVAMDLGRAAMSPEIAGVSSSPRSENARLPDRSGASSLPTPTRVIHDDPSLSDTMVTFGTTSSP